MSNLKWWQKAVFYQIYPRSFADGNGDGIGDLPGILSRLDHLRDLGVDAIWLSPHYPSPQFDCGYDISDYTAVDPNYGTLDDFQRFLEGAHARGLRVILDLVLNHTSDQHPWFLESRSSRDNPKRDWYIWHDGRGSEPHNNWYSTFGGSAWTLDPETGQYFYHFFFRQQPDLNWRNPEVQEAMFNAVRFWLDRGVDGFRLDAIGAMYEDASLADHDCPYTLLEVTQRLDQANTAEEREHLIEMRRQLFRHQHSLPEVHDIFRQLRKVVDQYPDRVLVGETEDISYLGTGQDELDLVFNFHLMRTQRLTPEWVLANQQQRLSELRQVSPDAWPCNTLNNHDTSRVWSAYGDGEHDAQWARISLALMLTLPGTPFLYYGEEIGMRDLLLQDISQFRDLLGVWRYNAELENGARPQVALDRAAHHSRDRCRTPMQWNRQPNAGFCPEGVIPWLPLNPNYSGGINVEEQQADPDSLLSYYRRLLGLRRSSPALLRGDFQPVKDAPAGCLAFTRHDPESAQRLLIAINMSDASIRLPGGRELGPFEVYIGD